MLGVWNASVWQFMGVEAPRPPCVVGGLGESCYFGEVAACGEWDYCLE